MAIVLFVLRKRTCEGVFIVTTLKSRTTSCQHICFKRQKERAQIRQICVNLAGQTRFPCARATHVRACVHTRVARVGAMSHGPRYNIRRTSRSRNGFPMYCARAPNIDEKTRIPVSDAKNILKSASLLQARIRIGCLTAIMESFYILE